jgi:hypothetical protein
LRHLRQRLQRAGGRQRCEVQRSSGWKAAGFLGLHKSAYVSIRQHTAHVSIRACIRQHRWLPAPAYVSIRQHTSAYVSIRQHTSAYVSRRQHTCLHTSAYPAAAPAPVEAAECLRHYQQHTSAYVSIRQHTSEADTLRGCYACASRGCGVLEA